MNFLSRRWAACCALIIGSLLCVQVFAAVPKVLKATPDNGDKDVDAATVTELRVTFDQAMDTGGFSWCGGGDSFPKTAGKPHWIDDRTCVLPVKLEPDHDYWTSINSPSHTLFRNPQGEAVVPYPIAFSTKANAVPALTPAQNQNAIATLRTAIDKNYSHRDQFKVDWDKRFADAAPKLEAAQTARDFANLAAAMLAPAKDLHLWLKVGSRRVPTYTRQYTANFNPESVKKLVSNWKSMSPSVYAGQCDGGIAYIVIASWMREDPPAGEAAFAAIGQAADAKAMIIDIRPNPGGDDSYAREVAGCFIDAPKPYGKCTIFKDGQTSPLKTFTVQPNWARPKYRGKVVVLMGPGNVSSAEDFLLMMKQVPGCRLIGATSGGASGNPQPYDLGNGVTAFVPSWIGMQLDGTPIEGRGIDPDIKVETTPAQLAQHDPILEAALALLRDESHAK